MTLGGGTKIGVYEITGAIGAGGMGEVYRARDTRLDRDVAIKILPALFATEPERLSRFDREAKTLAALNHPNIAHIHGVIDEPPALVMELVEGDDLAQRLARGPVPIDEAIGIARQIADALEAAHDLGIVHRDLKPANVKVRSDGTVKVLDFGLAKALDSTTVAGPVANGPMDERLQNSPTFTSPARLRGGYGEAGTEMGVILGTAAYMAPEQARGRTIDRRADIWAFGCVLYEMLSGQRPFAGDDTSMMLAAVLKQDVDYGALPADTPPSIRRLLRRCLEKDPRKRLSAISDARLELDDAAESADAPAVTATRTGWRVPLAWAAAGALLATVVVSAVFLLRAQPRSPRTVVHSEIPLGDRPLELIGNRAFALDPSGSELVFAAQLEGERHALFRRRLDSEQAVAIPGTEWAIGPFFSPDGQWLAFMQNGRLKKMPAAGGMAVELAEVRGLQGGSFLPDGSILFNTAHGEGLFRVTASGSDLAQVTTVDREKGESGHHWPHVLPGGTHALITVELDGKPYSDARIMLLSLKDGERRPLIEGGTDPRYLASGHIVYWHDQSIWSAPFDPSTMTPTGPASAVVRDVMIGEANGMAHFSVAGNGTLVYLRGRDTQTETAVMLVDRQGSARELTAERKEFATPAVSADGRRLALTIAAANDSLWTMDMDRKSLTRITYEAENALPVWSPDGTRLALTRHRGGEARQLFMMPSDGSQTPELLHASDRPEIPDSWTAHGDLLAFSRREPNGWDIWVMSMTGDRTPRAFLSTRFDEHQARFSPDGQWMAYTSDESGRREVYVRPFPGPGQKRLVSTDGGSDPRWRADGREIFYRLGGAVLAADVTLSPGFSSSLPRLLVRGPYMIENWDVLPDGQAFLMLQDFSQPRTAVTLVQNWSPSR